VKLFIIPRVPWRDRGIMLQLVEQARNFGVLQSFLTNNLEPIWNNEGEGEKGVIFFIFFGKSIRCYIFLSLLVNYLIIIAK
jgi:hypothetical protein